MIIPKTEKKKFKFPHSFSSILFYLQYCDIESNSENYSQKVNY